MTRRRRSKNRILVPEAKQAMDQFKYEMASELGINPEYKSLVIGATFLPENVAP